MKEYLLIFRGGDAKRLQEQQSPEAWQQHMMKWKTWMDGLASEGKFSGGQPLNNIGTTIHGINKRVVDGPYAEGKEIVGGYLLIRAADQNEAVELSKNCPLLEHNGIVEVREIQELKM